MGATVTFHSYKGGTGKTSFAIGVAQAFAREGKRVCLMDLDFRGPTIAFAYNLRTSHNWTNDYLNGTCGVDKVLVDVSDEFRVKGQLLIAPANYDTEAIRDMSAKDRKWEMRALGRLLALRISLLKDLKLDYLLLDASSGLAYSSINAVVCADVVTVVNTAEVTQAEGTRLMLREFYDLFEKKTSIVLNKVPTKGQSLTDVEMSKRVEYENLYKLPVLGVMPCFCELLEAGLDPSFLQKKPRHLYVKILGETASRIASFASGESVIRKDSELMKIYREQFIKKVTGVVT
ncbi:AAA family ATPase [Candidatus Bathyarchaeota archaeon]|nr:AAA family ATPase [Candidatus Bathyarchaeota archaeon]